MTGPNLQPGPQGPHAGQHPSMTAFHSCRPRLGTGARRPAAYVAEAPHCPWGLSALSLKPLEVAQP